MTPRRSGPGVTPRPFGEVKILKPNGPGLTAIPDGHGRPAPGTGTPGYSVARVAEGGGVLQRVDLPENRAPFALMLGGPDRRTLFILTCEWRPADGHVANLDRLANGPRTGEILTLRVPVPGAGRP